MEPLAFKVSLNEFILMVSSLQTNVDLIFRKQMLHHENMPI